MIENGKKIAARGKGVWCFRCTAPRNSKTCPVHSCIVAAIPNTVECKLYRTENC